MSELPDYESALALALAGIAPLDRHEQVGLQQATGRVLAETVVADRDLPPFDRAQMDGYALRADSLRADCPLPVIATIPAGAVADVVVPHGSCVAIATGAPLPGSVDTVIQHELSDRKDPVRFTIDAIETGHAVHPRGADARAGDPVLQPGTELRGLHIGIAATVGSTTLRVHARPRVTILTSGDEVQPVEAPVASHQIRNSNGPQLESLLPRFGATVIASVHVLDDVQATTDAVARALGESDVVLTVGGISAGQRDYFPTAFEACNVQQSLSGAAIQPGKPVRVGRHESGAVVVGLPGNPVSVLACACLFAWPIIRVLGGLPATLPWQRTALADDIKPNPRRQAFRPAVRVDDHSVRVPSWAGSGDLAHTAVTDGLAQLAVQAELMRAGDTISFLPWP